MVSAAAMVLVQACNLRFMQEFYWNNWRRLQKYLQKLMSTRLRSEQCTMALALRQSARLLNDNGLSRMVRLDFLIGRSWGMSYALLRGTLLEIWGRIQESISDSVTKRLMWRNYYLFRREQNIFFAVIFHADTQPCRFNILWAFRAERRLLPAPRRTAQHKPPSIPEAYYLSSSPLCSMTVVQSSELR